MEYDHHLLGLGKARQAGRIGLLEVLKMLLQQQQAGGVMSLTGLNEWGM